MPSLTTSLTILFLGITTVSFLRIAITQKAFNTTLSLERARVQDVL